MGASCCSSQAVAKDPSAEAPDSLPPVSQHDSESHRKKRALSVPAVETTSTPVPSGRSPSVARTTTTIKVPPSTSAHMATLDPALDLLTDTFAVSATTLSEPGDMGEDASSWVDVSMLTHSIHPHLRTASDLVSECDLASWDPKVDRARVAQRRERERFMRAEVDNRARVEQRFAESRCKLLVRAYKEAFMLQRRALLREFFLARLALFIDACDMQAVVGCTGLAREEAMTWQTLLESVPASSPIPLSAEATTPPDRFAHTTKRVESLEESHHPSQSLTTTTVENDPLSSSFGDCTSSAARACTNGSGASTHHADPRSVLYSKTVARVEQTKQTDI